MRTLKRLTGSGAIACFILAMMAPLLAWTSFTGMEAAAITRSPVQTQIPSEATLALTEKEYYVGGKWIFVSYITPLKNSAPPPPGLTKWPEPGQAFVSPALNTPAWHRILGEQFGTISGDIGPQPLAAANELMIYSRPALSSPHGHFATGFGGLGYTLGIPGSPPSQGYVWIFSALLGCVPGLIFIAAVRLQNRRERYRDEELLRYLGASTPAIWAWNSKRYGPQLLAGTLMAALALGVCMVVNVRPPLMDWTLTARFVRAQWIPILLALAGLALLAFLFLVLPSRSARIHKAGAYTAGRRHMVIALIGLASIVVTVNWAIQLKTIQQYSLHSSPSWTYVHFLGGMIAILTFPALATWISQEILGSRFKSAWDKGRVPTMAAFRSSGAHTAIRPSMTLSTISIIISLLVAAMGALPRDSREALDHWHQLGERFQSLYFNNLKEGSSGFSPQQAVTSLTKLQAAFPEIEFVTISQDSKRTKLPGIQGSPLALASLGMASGTGQDLSLLNKESQNVLKVSKADVTVGDPFAIDILAIDREYRLLLFRVDGQPLSSAALRTLAFQLAGANISIEPTATSGFFFAADQIAQIQHFVFSLALAALVLIGIAFWLLALADVRRESRRIAGFAALGWDRSIINAVLARAIVWPAALVSLLTFAISLAINYPAMWGDVPAVSPVLTAAVVALLPLMGSIIIYGFLRQPAQQDTTPAIRSAHVTRA